MDVHPPHEAVHTWRDALVHLGIVTAGLFIALMLESAVEWMHHRHVVREARENIRREIEHNHEDAEKDIRYVLDNVKTQQENIETIHRLRDHPQGFQGSVLNHMEFDSLDDGAWRTARDTGALGYMPYDEVQRYSDLYMMAELVNQHAIKTGEADFLAGAAFKMGYDPEKLPAEEYERLLRDNAAVRIQLETLSQFLTGFDKLAEQDLKR